jgi:hypothetical protein
MVVPTSGVAMVMMILTGCLATETSGSSFGLPCARDAF